MKTAFLSPVLGSLSLTLATFALPAIGAPTVYEMRLTTSGGMGAGGGMAAMFGAMSGGSSVTRSMHLQLTSPSDIPAGYDANHTVPDAMRIGPQLPLRGERRSGGSGGAPGDEREPDGRVLIYWGCSATVPKGQPEVIDFRALAGKVPPEIMGMARQSRNQGKSPGGETSLPPRSILWPNADRDFKGIPAEASAVGEHLVKASFMKDDIRYNLTPALDFLEPMNLKARSENLKAAVPLTWDALARSRGWDLQAFGANGEKEMVIWMAARNKQPMLPASQHECTIPEGIFAKSEMAMLTGIAHGPVQGFSYPPQPPGEKKLPLIWSATVRVMGYDNVMLGMPTGESSRGRAEQNSAPAGESAADALLPSGVGNVLKGIFGR